MSLERDRDFVAFSEILDRVRNTDDLEEMLTMVDYRIKDLNYESEKLSRDELEVHINLPRK